MRVYGHRGAAGHRPENTLASVRHALALGALARPDRGGGVGDESHGAARQAYLGGNGGQRSNAPRWHSFLPGMFR